MNTYYEVWYVMEGKWVLYLDNKYSTREEAMKIARYLVVFHQVRVFQYIPTQIFDSEVDKL